MGEARQARRLLADIRAVDQLCAGLQARPDELASAALATVDVLRREAALVQVDLIPLGRLKETAKGLRLDALERAGYRSVAQVLAASEHRLLAVPGVGESTARQVRAAGRQVLAATQRSVRLHFDVVARPQAQTEVLVSLRRYDLARRAADEAAPVSESFRSAVAPLTTAAEPAARSWLRRAFTGSQDKAAAKAALTELERLLTDPNVQQLPAHVAASTAEIERERSADETWTDYENDAARLLGVLAEIAGSGDQSANQGHLPEEIVERVQALTLDLSFMKASLRGYQAFGAKYALVQRRTILGDEMGLGKTIEALAALSHLRAGGHHKALVVCPASVVANWRSEIHRHSKLDAHVIHGQERDRAARIWTQRGGVAVTTFDGLRRIPLPEADNGDNRPLGMLVVDEAHYVKNPATLRAQAVAGWAARADRVLFLTGTPMENRVEEFQALIEHLRPDIATRVNATTALAGPVAFQTAVAPAYLRRNQTDVLDELPELIPSLDWVDPTSADLAAYEKAVDAGAFMQMRRAAYTSVSADGPASLREADRSAKLARLIDIVDEAGQEGLKVVVFSYFRDVLATVTRALSLAAPGSVHGPLTGNTPPAERQRLVEALGTHSGGAVLVSQIEAGGVGLNIQSASVVVLCEPQWKPTIEAQAIARCHRMGQVRRVQVHRLLLENTVDQRMLAILAGKQHLIEQFVQGSAVKDATPDAVDISDLEQVETVVNEAQAEALIIASERRRLGLDAVDAAADAG